MKQNSIQHLLAKRQAGTLTDTELDELNQLTRKDEVLAAAEHAAVGIVRRRKLRNSLFALVAVAVVAAGIIMIFPKHEVPMVAQQQPAPQPVVVEPMPQTVETPAAPVATKPTTAPKPKATVPAQRPASIAPSTIEPHKTDPTVMCNNQCEADSVINDIWKFLTA